MIRNRIKSLKTSRCDSLGIMTENFDEYFDRYVKAKEDGTYTRDMAALKEISGYRREGVVPEDYDDSNWDADTLWYEENEESETDGYIRISGEELYKKLCSAGVMKPREY